MPTDIAFRHEQVGVHLTQYNLRRLVVKTSSEQRGASRPPSSEKHEHIVLQDPLGDYNQYYHAVTMSL
jgi:hypothetical protein